MQISIIGGGLAGCEATWQIVRRGIGVRLIEMKPLSFSPAHDSPDLAELVCSNSLRSSSLMSAAGLLKEELRIMDSLIMEAADATAVPAGKALAVDRKLFARFITERICNHPLVELEAREVRYLPPPEEGLAIVATGPLTTDPLAADIMKTLGSEGLYFYDAIAPIVNADSLDMTKLFRASRYEDGAGDYLNAALDEAAYRDFVSRILGAEKVDPYPFENIPHFEGCLPVEELARRGPNTLAFGPMKPVGLVNPVTGRRPYAVVQLRAENHERTLYNLVGFQTKMTHPEQERVFRHIPGLENAEFARLGSIHRNTFLDAPRLLDGWSRSQRAPHLFFAGQMTGVEGYIESTASGLAVGIMATMLAQGLTPQALPETTAMGALLKHTRDESAGRYEPMNINFGIIAQAPAGTPKHSKKEVIVERALKDLRKWKVDISSLGGNQ